MNMGCFQCQTFNKHIAFCTILLDILSLCVCVCVFTREKLTRRKYLHNRRRSEKDLSAKFTKVLIGEHSR